MNWKISISKPDNMVVVETSGKFNFKKIVQMTTETFETASDNGIRKVLGDHRGMVPAAFVADIYQIPRELRTNEVVFPARVALVYSEASGKKEDFGFFETTASNTGMHVQLFTDIEAARMWLKE